MGKPFALSRMRRFSLGSAVAAQMPRRWGASMSASTAERAIARALRDLLSRRSALERADRNDRRSALADAVAVAQGPQDADHRLRQRRGVRPERRISARQKPERGGAGSFPGRAQDRRGQEGRRYSRGQSDRQL